MNIIDSISSHSLWLKLNKKFKIIPISPASYPYCEYKDIQSISGINLYNNNLLLNKHVNPFHSNSDEKRFEDLYKALNIKDENVIIWCINGGYGSAKLIPFLENVAKPNIEKIFIGYSDITALHMFFSQKWDWKTIHGPCLGELFKKDKDINNFLNLFDCLLRKDFTNRKFVKCIKPLNLAAEKFKDKVDLFKFTGGNLALIQTSLGTSWQIDIKNKVLFLEDIGEAGYKIDRMLNHISSVLNIRSAKAIIFGEFVNSDEFIDFTISNFVNLNSSIPIYKIGKLGHGKYNLPVIYN